LLEGGVKTALTKIQRAFEKAGVEFPEAEPVRLRKEK
jgi:hypothetical protein